MAVFEIFLDISRHYRFRLKAPNGEIIATSQAYTTKQACQHGIQCVRVYAPTAAVRDLTY